MASPEVRYLVVHTAAADLRDVDASVIDKWHKKKGWAGIGYHYVILDDRHGSKADGTVERGRPLDAYGAHAQGLNSKSIGICCAGHGDLRELTSAQETSLVELLADLSAKYSVPTKKIIGHREINKLVDRGELSDQYRTTKTCPGDKVDMDDIRSLVSQALASRGALIPKEKTEVPSAEELRIALRTLDRAASAFGNAGDEWRVFRNHPETLRAAGD